MGEETKRICPGSGHPAVAKAGDVYPYCPSCGRQMAAQGRKAQRRFRNAWTSVPRHMKPVDA